MSTYVGIKQKLYTAKEEEEEEEEFRISRVATLTRNPRAVSCVGAKCRLPSAWWLCNSTACA